VRQSKIKRIASVMFVVVLGWLTMPAVAGVFYANDFENMADPLTEWSDPSTYVTPGTSIHPADRFLGRFSNGTLTLSLSALPDHNEISVSFDLYIIHSWDGNRVPPDGPDVWDVSVVGGPTLLHTTFSNSGDHNQAYPNSYPGGENPAFTGITEPIGSLGFVGGSGDDTTYGGLSFTFPHAADALTLSFSGIGLQGVGDESWGLDNVVVTPEPSMALFVGAASLFALRRRRHAA